MSSWAIPGIKSPGTAGWNTSSFNSAPKVRRIKFPYKPKVGSGLGRRSWNQETYLPFRHCIEVPGPRPSPCTARKGSKRISKLDDHVSANFPNLSQASLDDCEKEENMDFGSSKGLNEELRSAKSRFAPFGSHFGMPGRGRSFMNHVFAGGYEREINHKEVVRRLNSMGAADKSEGCYGGSRTEGDSFGSTSFGHGSDDIKLLGKGKYGQRGRAQECNEGRSSTNYLAMEKRRVPLSEHDEFEQGQWARRSLLSQCIPAILEKLGFNFSLKNLAANRAYEMRYQLSSDGNAQFLYRNETGKDFLKHDGKLPSLTTDSIGQVARPVNFLTSSKSNTGAKISDRREAVNQLEYGRSPSSLSNPYSNSQMMVPNARRLRSGVRGGGQKPGRLWLQADGDANPPQSTIWRDMFTIIGLSAFLVCGTYAFAVSNRYLKFGSKNKYTSVTTRSHCGSDSHSTACSKQPSVIELTNCNFETSVSKKPTFVLFYAPWCSHCQQLEHTWKDLACRLPKMGFDVQLAQMDAEKFGQVAEKYKVVKYPTLIFFKDGKPTENHTGPRDVDSLMTFIDENYNG